MDVVAIGAIFAGVVAVITALTASIIQIIIAVKTNAKVTLVEKQVNGINSELSHRLDNSQSEKFEEMRRTIEGLREAQKLALSVAAEAATLAAQKVGVVLPVVPSRTTIAIEGVPLEELRVTTADEVPLPEIKEL
ncbi:MAG: hypothetical protein H0U59_11075 [Gemmatimonadaceae bacterium]|nr:hypothetical protein [Gemmatimonadaceae bacterium]